MKTNHTIIMGSLGLLSFTILSGVFLSSNTTSADTEVIDQVRLTVPIACTMTGENTSHTATLDPGTYSGATGSEYENGIGKTTMTAICNDDNGFSIYAIGYTGNEYGATNLIGNNTNGTIATKAYQSGDTTSNWSMKLTKVTDTSQSYNPTNLTITTSYDTWHAVPDTYTKVAQYKANTGSSTTDTTLGVKLETTYAAYISTSQAADIYEGQVKYIMVHPYNKEAPLSPQTATSGCINYFPNGNNVEGTMGCQSVSTSATSATLLASNFSRQGYGFAGWSNKFDYVTNPNQEGIKFYGPNETISFTAGEYTGTNPGLSLYAIWIKSEGNLQDTSKVTTVCSGLTQAPTDGTANLSSVSALTDQRDNETYAIAKLADGNCWIIENLRLDNTAELTTTNTNNPLNDGTNARLKHNYTDINTYNTLSPTSAIAYDATTAPDGWCTTNSAACADQSRLRTDNTTNRATGNPNTGTGSMYSYGNYYNWYSATAGKGTFNRNSNNYNTKTQSVNGDLCPSGWKLPLGTQSTGDIEQGAADTTNRVGGFSYLDRKMGGTGGSQSAGGSSRWLKFPVNILFSSSVNGESFDNRGNHGYYWSSTEKDSFSAYGLNLGRSYVSPIGNAYKYNGGTIRCITSS